MPTLPEKIIIYFSIKFRTAPIISYSFIDIEKCLFNGFAMCKDVYMMSPWNHTEVSRHIKFVNGSLTNYITLIIKLIPAFGVFDISDGKTGLTGESSLEVKTQAIEECTSPFGSFMKS